MCVHTYVQLYNVFDIFSPPHLPPPPPPPSVDPDQLLTHHSSSYAAGSGDRGEGGATGRRTGDAHPHSERKTVGLPSGELTLAKYVGACVGVKTCSVVQCM